MKPLLIVSLLLSCAAAIAQLAPPPESQDFALWGVTLGKALDHVKFPWCERQSVDDIIKQAPRPTSCLTGSMGIYELQGVPWPNLPSLRIVVAGGGKVANPVDEVSLEIADMYCDSVLQVLTKKFGQPTSHKSFAMQNGFGAKWDAESWDWLYPNNGGTKLLFQHHVSEADGCFLLAKSEVAARPRPAEVPEP